MADDESKRKSNKAYDDRPNKRPKRIYILWVLLFIYVCCAAILFCLQIYLENDVVKLSGHARRLHAPLSLGGIVCMSFGIAIYRIFAGFRTRRIKYVHAILLAIGIVLLLVGFVEAVLANKEKPGVVKPKEKEEAKKPTGEDQSRAEPKLVSHLNNLTHYVLGYMVISAIVVQFILGLIIFIFVKAEGNTRRYFAPFHDIVGTWIYLGLGASYLTGLYYMYDVEVGCCEPSSTTASDILHYLTVPVYVHFLIIFGIILSPYYEWDLVGRV